MTGLSRMHSFEVRSLLPASNEEIWDRAFRSIILLGKVLPVDYYDVCFIGVQPGRRFHERSSSLFVRLFENRHRFLRASFGVHR